MTKHYADDLVTLYAGDCLRDGILAALPDDSVDAVVTDPPYGLEFMGREWDGADGFRRSLNAADVGRDNAFGRASRTSPEYRAGEVFQEWCESWATECLRVLKPGGHLLAFGGTRTWHRLACAVEDAGFEMRDSIAWLYGSGFPKSLNLVDENGDRTGWGTALKPAFEPIVVSRKPLIGTVVANVLAHGTGALNIDGCRVGSGDDRTSGGAQGSAPQPMSWGEATGRERPTGARWPANVVLDESRAAELDRQSGTLTSGKMLPTHTTAAVNGRGNAYGKDAAGGFTTMETYGDSGGASRFFPTFRYEAKAPTVERPRDGEVAHPTVKPLDLMRWLVRLVTPPGGTVLDPFAGSGTTAEACVVEGFRCITIERETDYLPLIVRRLSKPIQPDMFGGAA